ncbi:MAG: hypothetical protein B2I17_02160 [Thermoplasmatales archaeon B_DKE]|nr:MAG: hypothetical protein B2I17_02160 [Thermoplasmatales archaeon B_DKE]
MIKPVEGKPTVAIKNGSSDFQVGSNISNILANPYSIEFLVPAYNRDIQFSIFKCGTTFSGSF